MKIAEQYYRFEDGYLILTYIYGGNTKCFGELISPDGKTVYRTKGKRLRQEAFNLVHKEYQKRFAKPLGTKNHTC